MASRVSFTKATKTQSRLRMTIDGPSGSGKTFTALRFGMALANGGKLALIDTERGSASKYAGEDTLDGEVFAFDVIELQRFSPADYIAGIEAAGEDGYKVLIIDSLSHAWEGTGGVLEMHDDATQRSRSKNSYMSWREVTPQHRALVDAILQSPCHVITTMRSKTVYIQSKDSRGKTTVDKVGMAPIQRPGMEYEFDVVADMDTDHTMVISKSRITAIDRDVVKRPGAKWLKAVQAWLTDGTPEPEKPKPAPEPDPAAAQKKRDDAPPADSTRRSTKPANGKPAPVGWATWPDSAHRRFWANAGELNLSDDTLHHEFGVASMKDWTGTMGDAKAVLDILAYGIKQGMGLQGIREALDVAAVHEWDLTAQDAIKTIDLWVEVQEKASQKREAQREAAKQEQMREDDAQAKQEAML